MGNHFKFSNYSPQADIVDAGICLVMAILVVFSYLSRERKSRLFLSMVALVFTAACADITFYILAAQPWAHCLAS